MTPDEIILRAKAYVLHDKDGTVNLGDEMERLAACVAHALAEIEKLRPEKNRLRDALQLAQVYVETDYDPGPAERGADAAVIRAALAEGGR